MGNLFLILIVTLSIAGMMVVQTAPSGPQPMGADVQSPGGDVLHPSHRPPKSYTSANSDAVHKCIVADRSDDQHASKCVPKMQNNGRRDGLQNPIMQTHKKLANHVFVSYVFLIFGFCNPYLWLLFLHIWGAFFLWFLYFCHFAVGPTCLGRCIR